MADNEPFVLVHHNHILSYYQAILPNNNHQNFPPFDRNLQKIRQQVGVGCRLCGLQINGITYCGVCRACTVRQLPLVLDRDQVLHSFCNRHRGYVPIICKLPHPPGLHNVPGNCNKCERRALIGSPQDRAAAGYGGFQYPNLELITRYYNLITVDQVLFEGELAMN